MSTAKKSKKFIGYYSTAEIIAAKRMFMAEHNDYLPYQAEGVLRAVAKYNWPEERVKAYTAAKNNPHPPQNTWQLLGLFDEVQTYLDRARHGDSYIRVWKEAFGVPESHVHVDENFSRAISSASAVGIQGKTGPGQGADAEHEGGE